MQSESSHDGGHRSSRVGQQVTRLRFAIDVDGTISQAPHHFRRLIDALLQSGNEVFIITGRRESLRAETAALLSGFGITYTDLVMRPDSWPASVADFKVQAVKERDVHLMVDDNISICWAIQQQTEALAAHMLPIPEQG